VIDCKCEYCQTDLKCYPSKPKRYCSPECASAARTRACLISKVCSHCGEGFTIKRYRDNEQTKDWFCCKDHQSAFYVGKKAANPRPVTKRLTLKCGHCEMEFTCWASAERKYCSQKCAKEASKNGVVSRCKLCDKEFYKTTAKHNAFCCKKHWDEWRVLARPKTKCEVCGEEFEQPGPSGKAKFCSNECRMREAVARLPAMLKKLHRHKGPNKFEKAAYRVLRQAGVSFIPQYPMGDYIIDAAIVCHKIAVHLDGDYWHGNEKVFPALNEKQLARRVLDERIDEFLRREGWKSLRVWESDFQQNPSCLIDRLGKLQTGENFAKAYRQGPR